MGTVILADVTELTTVKISELPEMLEASDEDVVPMLDKDITATKGTKRENLIKTAKIDGGSF